MAGNNWNTNQPSPPGSGYTYVQGLGFVSYGPANKERAALVACANAVGLAVLLYLFLSSVTPSYLVGFMRLFMPHLRYFNSHLMAPEWVGQLIQALSFVICSVVAFGIYMALIRIPARVALPLRRAPGVIAAPAVFIGLAVSALGSFAANLLSMVFGWFGAIPVTPDISVSTTASGLVWALVNVCLLPAFLEECIYRGVLMQSLRRFGDGFALVISAVLFSLMHRNVLQAPIALLMGLVIGYFVLRTGSLWTGVLMHFCNNLLAVTQQVVTPMLEPEQGRMLGTILVLFYLVMGLVSILVLSRSGVNLFHLNQSPSALPVRQRAKLFFTCPAMVIALVLIIWLARGSVQFLPR